MNTQHMAEELSEAQAGSRAKDAQVVRLELTITFDAIPQY